jgi:hypothetical protein
MELTQINQWYYNAQPFTKEAAAQKIEEGYIGFIYEITDNLTGKKYIGKKLMVGKRRLPPLKGQKRKRVKMVESDWEKYFGSSELLSALVEERQNDFSREVLFLCKSKGELNYTEAREQFAREVLLSDDYYNNLIAVKIHGSHVNSLRKK